MNTIYLIRHSLTRANEERLYCGWTDLPLTESGVAHAASVALSRPLPRCSAYLTSGMKRANQTLELLAGSVSHEAFPDLKEMNFGKFEMFSYEQLLNNPDYIRWIEDETGDFICPGGESQNVFHSRVTRCADELLQQDIPSLMVVCHGGVIANIMQHWFPFEEKNFYQWQPSACGGYAITVEHGRAAGYSTL